MILDYDPHPTKTKTGSLVINEFGVVHYKEKIVSFFDSQEDYQAGNARWHQEFAKEVLPPFPTKLFVLVIAGKKEYFLNVEDGSIFCEQSLKEI